MLHQPRYHYQRYGVGARSIYVACWAIFFALGVATALAPTARDSMMVHGIGIVTAAVTGFFLTRAFRWATIDVSPDGVVIRGTLRTSRVAMVDFDRFIVVPGLGPSAQPASALAVRTKTGRTLVFDQFWRADEAVGNPADTLADKLNAWVASSTSAAGSAAA